MKINKPDITENYEFEGYLPDGHFSIGDVIHHPQGDAIRFEGNEADIKAIAAVPDMLDALIDAYELVSDVKLYTNLGKDEVDRRKNKILRALGKAGCSDG